ncbi:MAG: polysaccharide biosynthesis tyrosine autokinase [Phycisphaerales bacterium]
MTTVPLNPSQPRPQSQAHTPVAQAALGAIDPIKLLNKYKWLLAAAAIFGAALGVGSHLVLGRLAPVWRPTIIFKCLPPQSANPNQVAYMSSEDTTRFMATEAKHMVQESILTRVANSIELQNVAPKWCARFMKTGAGGTVFDSKKALEELVDHARARIYTSTVYIELSFGWRDPVEATSILRLIGDAYRRDLDDNSKALSDDLSKAIRESITQLSNDNKALVLERNNITSAQNDGTVVERKEATLQELGFINEEIVRVQGQHEDARQQYESLLAQQTSPAGITYTDEIIDSAERDPAVMDSKQQVNILQTSLQALRDQGYGPDHRSVRSVESQLNASKATLERNREEAQRKLFASTLERAQRITEVLLSTLSTLNERKQTLALRLNDLLRIEAQLEDIRARLENNEQARADRERDLQEVLSAAKLETASRVVIAQPQQVPNEPDFPKIALMLPAGVLLMVTLVGGIAVARELIDQRVKSPADITAIPRTKLLGWIPDAAEDHITGGTPETAFRDAPQGVVAESFRQLRASVLKRAQIGGLRTIVVTPGLPESGATSIVANLALAAAAADLKVLAVDANFRKPALHKVFARPEHPGLSDILSGEADLHGSIQHIDGTLDFLPAGSRTQRVVERLASDTMGLLLTDLRHRYDIILIDTPPAIVAGDGVALASRCDASILVVKAFGEKRGMIARVRNELIDTKAEFLGVVINAVRAASGGYLRGNIRVASEYNAKSES